jgi:hypothetical protein
MSSMAKAALNEANSAQTEIYSICIPMMGSKSQSFFV